MAETQSNEHAPYSHLRVIAPRVEVRGSAGSTNADLVAALAAEGLSAWPHLSVLLTEDQRAGRGRLDRSWIAPAGSAIAVSVVVDPSGVAQRMRGWIPLAAGVAMSNAISAQLPGRDVGVKWPNDVLVAGKKICGILAEVVPGGAVVVGAGVNTQMSAAILPVPTATSFAVEGEQVDADRLLTDYVEALGSLLSSLADSPETVREAVVASCVTVGKHVRVELPAGDYLSGEAIGIDDEGRLLVDAGGSVRAVAAGDVVHVR